MYSVLRTIAMSGGRLGTGHTSARAAGWPFRALVSCSLVYGVCTEDMHVCIAMCVRTLHATYRIGQVAAVPPSPPYASHLAVKRAVPRREIPRRQALGSDDRWDETLSRGAAVIRSRGVGSHERVQVRRTEYMASWRQQQQQPLAEGNKPGGGRFSGAWSAVQR